MSILQPDQSYTFSKIFELKIIPKNITQEFGYNFSRQRLNLPQFAQDLERTQLMRILVQALIA